ncbi:MAG: hypothetical protein EXR48_03080 [Dehalococcoidia bacterium]|nr:hypothetical protein [Dehalococcoidia bacterium]
MRKNGGAPGTSGWPSGISAAAAGAAAAGAADGAGAAGVADGAGAETGAGAAACSLSPPAHAIATNASTIRLINTNNLREVLAVCITLPSSSCDNCGHGTT